MGYAISGIGFVFLAAVSLLHFGSLYRIAAIHGPGFQGIAAVAAGLLWLAFLGLVARGMYRNRLRLPFGVGFAYAMVVVLAGMRVLDGVPATIGDGQWSDPDNLLTQETEFVLHNHGIVKKVLSRQEYDLYSSYGLAYFSAAGMVFCMALSFLPLDRNGQLFQKRSPAVWAVLNQPQFPPWAMPTFPCPACGAAIRAADGDKPAPWCSHCGANL
jgi:hypothetical protein